MFPRPILTTSSTCEDLVPASSRTLQRLGYVAVHKVSPALTRHHARIRHASTPTTTPIAHACKRLAELGMTVNWPMLCSRPCT